ncbi:roadblock/LC7 domain-containing protein [Streptomyces sp. NPDC060002]|uniref:roadblock/LC7 domain-containing protein n=1 Tax=Streptomyces sp. NPDC060002 TaxID=3347033 RepID=UPI0036791DB4
MVSEPEILDELRRLRARVPQLTGALTAGVDGLVLAHDTPGVEPEVVAALTAAALGVAVRMADTTGQGDFRELLVRGVYGYVATYAAGESAVLTLLAQDRVNVGRLHLEGRRAGARIGELVDAWEAKAREAQAAAPEPARAPAKTPPKAPVRTPAKPPIVRTRSARGSATTNARTTTES